MLKNGSKTLLLILFVHNRLQTLLAAAHYENYECRFATYSKNRESQ
jgi:hypothetical protein